MADETAVNEAIHIALTAAQAEYADLEQTAMAVCQELEGEGALSGSSVASRLRSLGGCNTLISISAINNRFNWLYLIF